MKNRKQPVLADSAFIADGARVVGDVTVKEKVGIWYNATVRGDSAPIIIGEGSNIQDNAVIHVDEGMPCSLGCEVSVGHGAIVHGCEVGDGTLIGMGAILLNGVRVGKDCLIGAGTLITQNKEIPDKSLVLGSPGRVVRTLTEEEIAANRRNARIYQEEAEEMRMQCSES